MDEKELVALVRESETVRICRDLVRLESVNPPGNERAAAEYVAEERGKSGVQADLIGHGDCRASVLARLRGRGKAPALLYNGHLDTVPVGAEEWIHGPFSGEVAGGKVWGRGASDMKGGLAAMMAAMMALAESGVPLQGDLFLAATAGEEIDSLGAAEVARRLRSEKIRALFISEPTHNEIFIAEKGVLWLEVETFGKTAHGSMPEKGQNAIRMMMELLGEFEKLAVPHRRHPLLGGFSRSVNTISGGVKTNVVPDHCFATIDMRTVPGQDHSAILQAMEGIIRRLEERGPDFKARVRAINDHPAVETPPSDPALQEFSAVVEEVTGRRPVFQGANYFSDAVGFLPVLKVPLILCGPGEPGLAHQPDENVEISRLVEAAKIYTLAAAKFLGNGG